jgi:hypothetical protein
MRASIKECTHKGYDTLVEGQIRINIVAIANGKGTNICPIR